ncbi:hypothetical protein AB8Q18_08495 [Neisseriaceae bacterium CLB008]
MAARRSILDLPAYHSFVERYATNFELFCYEVAGLALSEDQQDFAHVIVDPRAKVSVVSGTGTGKTTEIAQLLLWHLWCHPVAYYDGKLEIGSNAYIGASSLQQVTDGVWKEMNDTIQRIKMTGHLNWLIQRTQMKAERVFIQGYKDQWFITKVAMAKGQSISIAGKHRYWQLIVVDEAAGVQDEHFNVINGTQTQDGNRTVLLSQGAKTTGFFYDSHHNLSLANDGDWVNLCFNSERAPHVSVEYLRSIALQAGGRDSVEYRVRVLGKFAENEELNLIHRRMIDAIYNEKSQLIEDGEPWGWFMLVDVGAGEYRDYSVCTLARVTGDDDITGPNPRRVEYVGIPLHINTTTVAKFKGLLLEIYGELSNARMLIDSGGNGLELCKALEDEGVDVHRVRWGDPCFKKENKKRFVNLRAQCYVHLRDAMRQKNVRFAYKEMSPALRASFIYQATHLPYFFTEKVQYQMMKKEDMRKQGIKSPDIMDTKAFAFLEGVHYNVSEAAFAGGTKKDKRKERMLAAKKKMMGEVA